MTSEEQQQEEEKGNEQEAIHIEDTQRLVKEIEMLKFVLFLVCINERKERKE